jgi:hypothetical protein
MGKIIQADTFVGETTILTSGFIQDRDNGNFFLPLNGTNTLTDRSDFSNTFVAPFNVEIDSIMIKNVSRTPSVRTVIIEVFKNERRETTITAEVQGGDRTGAYINEIDIGIEISALDTVSFLINTDGRIWEQAVFVIALKKR